MDWQTHWNTMPAALPDEALLEQVGKTRGGLPVRADTPALIAADVCAALHLGADDALLDLCCGNGLVTACYALVCASVTGVDFSAPLLRVAHARHAPPHVTYALADVQALPPALLAQRHTAIVLYEGLQHLTPDDAGHMLRQVGASASALAPVLFGSVPDEERLWRFYDTPERQAEYRRRVADGTEAIGRWWRREELSALGDRLGYRVEFRAQNPLLHTAHYRVDCLFTPVATAGWAGPR